jgi:hypothetical protein
MRSETFRRLNEIATSPVFWTSADVDTAINEGYAELSDASEWYERHLDIALFSNQPYYDARTVIGSEFLAPSGAFDYQTNRWLIPTTVRMFDAHDRRWERVDGEPQRVLTRGLWWLGYWPRVQSVTGGSIKQYYVALPPPLVNDTDEPGFPDTFHDGCIAFAVADLLAQDAEGDLAMLAWKTYLEIERELTDWVAGRASAAALHGWGAIGSVAQ